MSIWFKPYVAEDLHAWTRNTLVEHLGIGFREVGSDYLVGTLPVDHRTHQPMGILHGGASVALAETLGSLAASMCVDLQKYACVGQEINANHLRPITTGEVIGTARPIHIGRKSQVWQIEIRDSRDRLVCISRLTIAVIERDERLKALK